MRPEANVRRSRSGQPGVPPEVRLRRGDSTWRTTGWRSCSRRRGRSGCWIGSSSSHDGLGMRRRAGPLETVSVDRAGGCARDFRGGAAREPATPSASFWPTRTEQDLAASRGFATYRRTTRSVAQRVGAGCTAATGVDPVLVRAADGGRTVGWRGRRRRFPDQLVGRRFLVRGTHSVTEMAGRITLALDAGVAFGSGEHGSTRGLPAGAGDRGAKVDRDGCSIWGTGIGDSGDGGGQAAAPAGARDGYRALVGA